MTGLWLKRCAWHRKYRGWPWIFGVKRARGWGITDGVCPTCRAIFAEEVRAHKLARQAGAK